MSKRILRTVLVGLCIATVICCLNGCVEKAKVVENTYTPNYSLSTLKQSPDIKIDGVLDEAAWQGKSWFQNTYMNTNGTYPILKFTAFPSEYGVYVASIIEDKNLVTDGQRYPEVNSNWELYFAGCNADESLYSAERNGTWNVNRIYVDMRGESMSLVTNTERAVKVDGELNSGNTNSATLEMLVSWESLGVDTSKGIPETIAVMPWFRAVLASGGSTSYMEAPGSNLNLPASFYIFDKDGCTNNDLPGAVLGGANNGMSKSAGWDMSKQDEGIVRAINGGSAFIYFKEQQGENFIVEATLVPVKAVNDDWPKAGIVFHQTDGVYYTIMLDPSGKDGAIDSINGTKNFPNYQLTTLDLHDGNWNQYSLGGYDMSNPNAAKQEGVRLTVVKYGNKFWYYADGKYLTSQEVGWIGGDCFPGLYSLGYEVIFKDYSCKEIDLDGLKSYLNETSMYVTEVDVQGKGGNATASSLTVVNGGSYDISFTSKSGYRLSSVTINGKEMISSIQRNAKDGIYTVTGVKDNQNIVVAYEKIEGVTYSGIVTDGTDNLRADMILINQNDGSVRYEDRASGKGFEFEIPVGTYEVRVRTNENQWQSKIIEITADLEDEIVYKVESEEKKN